MQLIVLASLVFGLLAVIATGLAVAFAIRRKSSMKLKIGRGPDSKELTIGQDLRKVDIEKLAATIQSALKEVKINEASSPQRPGNPNAGQQ